MYTKKPIIAIFSVSVCLIAFSEAASANSSSLSNGVVDKMIGGVLVGAFLGFVVVIFRVFKWLLKRKSIKKQKSENVGERHTVSLKSNKSKDLEDLKSKSWYRFLKVLYIFSFAGCMASWFVFVPPISKDLNNYGVIINCEKQLSQPFFSGGGRLSHNNNLFRLNALEKVCEERGYYLNFVINYSSLLYLLATVVIFEVIRQAGYYIFLGKMCPNVFVNKVICLFKK